MAITLKYSEISNFLFAQTMQKIANFSTDGKTACRIRRVIQELKKVREGINAAYKAEIMEPFSLKGEDGKPVMAKDDQGFQPDPAKNADFQTAEKTFGERVATLECFPFTLETFREMKMSAAELESLRGLFDDSEPVAEAGPGVPSNVKKLR